MAIHRGTLIAASGRGAHLLGGHVGGRIIGLVLIVAVVVVVAVVLIRRANVRRRQAASAAFLRGSDGGSPSAGAPGPEAPVSAGPGLLQSRHVREEGERSWHGGSPSATARRSQSTTCLSRFDPGR